MNYNDFYAHDIICKYCRAIVMCEEFGCPLSHCHEGICDECSHYERHGLFDINNCEGG